MKEQILRLVDLQNVDSKIYEIKKQLKRLPEELDKMKVEFLPQKEKYENLKTGLKEKESLNLQYQSDLKGNEEKLKSLQKRLSEVKNAKELNAVDTEINSVKKVISETEDNNIKLLEEIDVVKKELTESEQIIQEEEKKINEIQNRINEETQKSEVELKNLNEEREKILVDIPADLLCDYDFIFKKRDGKAIVAVKNSTCCGCYMSVPPQTVNDVRKAEQIIHCQYCSRILYYPEWEN